MRTTGIYSVVILVLFLSACGDDKPTGNDSPEPVTVELGVVDNFPLITITSEDPVGMETLLCDLSLAGGDDGELECLLEKRRYASGRIYRVAAGYANYDSSGVLVGYTANVNGEAYLYGESLSSTVDCGAGTEVPDLTLGYEVDPSSSTSPLRAAAGVSQVYVTESEASYYGCFFNAYHNAKHEWLVSSIPAGSAYAPQTLMNLFIPDAEGDYVVGAKISTSAGWDAELLTFTAVGGHHILSTGGMGVEFYTPGFCWDGGGFWHFSQFGGLRKVNSLGEQVASVPIPGDVRNYTGLCVVDDEFWIGGTTEDYGDRRLFRLGPGGALRGSVPLTEIAMERPMLAHDGSHFWIGEWRGRAFAKVTAEGDTVRTFTLDASLGVINDLTSDGTTVWMALSSEDGRKGTVARFATDGTLIESWTLEFVHPVAIAFDGARLWCLRAAWGISDEWGPPYWGGNLTQLDLR